MLHHETYLFLEAYLSLEIRDSLGNEGREIPDNRRETNRPVHLTVTDP